VAKGEPGSGRSTAGLLSGPLLWLFLFFILPVCLITAYSVGGMHLLPTDTGGVTLHSWKRFLTGDSVYLALFWKSVRISLTVSIVVVLLSYPIGYFLALCVRKRKYVLLLVIIAPFLTSYLLRVLAWKVILGDRGVINSLLYQLHLRTPDQPVTWLIYSQFAVMLVLAYVWIPFVALPIFVGLNNLDPSLLEAAGDLGASRWRTFTRVTLPLSMPGVTAAFVFVFVPTIGEFVTPQIVGGSADGSNFLFGNAVNARFTQALDWQSGSVMALFLLVVVAVLMAIFGRRIQMKNLET
jgi:spermidine/putrescine transport system permease protein